MQKFAFLSLQIDPATGMVLNITDLKEYIEVGQWNALDGHLRERLTFGSKTACETSGITMLAALLNKSLEFLWDSLFIHSILPSSLPHHSDFKREHDVFSFQTSYLKLLYKMG